MEIREQQSLFSLLVSSFSVANRAGTALAVSILTVLILLALPLAAIMFLVHNPNSVKLWNVLWGLFAIFCLVWLQNACLRIIAAKAEQTDESVSDAFINSILPAVYSLIYQLIINFAFAIAGFLANLIPIVGPLIILPISIYFGLRLMFGQLAIALREQGPISAITYSWQLTSGRVLYVFAVVLLSGLIPALFTGLIAYGIIVGIPLYFADSFSLANLSMPWIIALVLIAFLFILICLAMAVFLVLVFLNMDYGFNRDTFIPLPQTKINNQTTQVFGPDNNVMPPGAGNPVTAQDIPQVEVLQASVRTEADNDELHKHLDKVYQPKPEDIIEYAEEDRMPTILFDDEMAKQLEQQRNAWQQKTNTEQNEKGDDDISSIKMSK